MRGRTCAGTSVTGTGTDGSPRAVYLYHLADELSVVSGGYLGDPAAAVAAAEAVRRQAG